MKKTDDVTAYLAKLPLRALLASVTKIVTARVAENRALDAARKKKR